MSEKFPRPNSKGENPKPQPPESKSQGAKPELTPAQRRQAEEKARERQKYIEFCNNRRSLARKTGIGNPEPQTDNELLNEYYEYLNFCEYRNTLKANKGAAQQLEELKNSKMTLEEQIDEYLKSSSYQNYVKANELRNQNSQHYKSEAKKFELGKIFQDKSFRTVVISAVITALTSNLLLTVKNNWPGSASSTDLPKVADTLILPNYCEAPNLQVYTEAKTSESVKNKIQEAKTCAELAMKWHFSKHAFEKILDKNINSQEKLDQTVIEIFKHWSEESKEVYPSVADRNRGILFRKTPQKVQDINQVIANFLSSGSTAYSSVSNLDNPMFYYLSSQVGPSQAQSYKPELDKAMNELAAMRSYYMQRLQNYYTIRTADFLKEGKSSQIQAEYDLIKRLILNRPESDNRSLRGALEDQGFKIETDDKAKLEQMLRGHLVKLVTANKAINFKLIQTLAENTHLTNQTPLQRRTDRDVMQNQAQNYFTVNEQVAKGGVKSALGSIKNPANSNLRNSPHLGVDSIIEPGSDGNNKTISSSWDKEAT